MVSTNMSSAYLNAVAAEKVYTHGRKEFDPAKEGPPVVITTCTSHGLHSSSRAWRDHMAQMLHDGMYT
jgi:hypothetical protein